MTGITLEPFVVESRECHLLRAVFDAESNGILRFWIRAKLSAWRVKVERSNMKKIVFVIEEFFWVFAGDIEAGTATVRRNTPPQSHMSTAKIVEVVNDFWWNCDWPIVVFVTEKLLLVSWLVCCTWFSVAKLLTSDARTKPKGMGYDKNRKMMHRQKFLSPFQN
jgi:hypothetical protein